MPNPQPGDFGVVSYESTGGHLISLGERAMNALGDKGKPQYDHAFVVMAPVGLHDLVTVIEAQPHGAQYGTYRVDDPRISWSRRDLTPEQREHITSAARGYLGTPYSWLDYWAIAAHSLHIPIPGLKRYIESTKSMICSQLVDQCYRNAGVQLFYDGRWSGYVTPSELGEFCS